MAKISRALLLLPAAASSIGFANPGIIEFSQAVFSVTEPVYDDNVAWDESTVEVTIVRHSGSSGRVAVVYCTAAIDSLSFARDGWSRVVDNRILFTSRDFHGSVRPSILEGSGTMLWEDGESGPKSFSVPIAADSTGEIGQPTLPNPLVEGTESLTLFLSTPEGGVELGANWMARIDILDAEAPAGGQGVVHFTGPRYAALENAEYIEVSISRSSGSNGVVSAIVETSTEINQEFNFNANPLMPAVPHADYVPISETLVWEDGDSEDKIVRLYLQDNASRTISSTSRGIKVIPLNLHSPAGGALTSVNQALGLIIDDESNEFDIWVENEAGKRLRVHIPDTEDPVRGIIMFLPGTGGDWRHKTGEVVNRSIARQYGFALVGQLANGFAVSEPYGVGQFYNILYTLAQFSGRPELVNAPVFFTGISAGSYNSISSSFAVPEQTLGFAGHRGAQFPFQSSVTMSAAERAVPGIMISGSLDRVTPSDEHVRRTELFRSQGEGGARVSTVVDWNIGHTSEGGQGWSMAYLFLDEVIRLRYPPNEYPGQLPGQRPTLRNIPLNEGWLAEQLNEFDEEGRPRPLSAPRDLVILSHDEVPESDRALLGWLPGKRSALAYQALGSLQSPLFPPSAPYQSRLKITSHLASNRTISTLAIGETTEVAVDPRSFDLFETIDFFYDTQWIGRRTEPPWSIQFKPKSTGIGMLHAVADGSHPYARCYAFEIVLVTGKEPAPVPPELNMSLQSPHDWLLSWPVRPYGVPDFVLESAPSPVGPWTALETPIMPGMNSVHLNIESEDAALFFRAQLKPE